MKTIFILLGFILCLTLQAHAQCGSFIQSPSGSPLCANTTYTYFAMAGHSPFAWEWFGCTVISGGGQNDASISVRWTSSTGQVAAHWGSCYLVNNVTVPIATVSGPVTACKSSVSVYTGDPGKSSYAWSYQSQVSGAVASAVASGNTYTVTWTAGATGFTVINLTYTASGGCTSIQGSRSTTIDTSAGISGPTSSQSCSSDLYTIPAGSTAITWSVSGGTLVDPNGTTSMHIKWPGGNNPDNGDVRVRARFTSAGGCVYDLSRAVTIAPIVPTITAQDGLDALNYCYKAPRTYMTNTGYSSYSWSVADTHSHSFNSTTGYTAPLTGAGGNIFPYGNTIISVQYAVLGTCLSATKQITVAVTPAPILFQGQTSSPSFCYTDSQGKGAYTTTAGNSSYSWVPTSGSVASGQGTNSVSINWPSSGTTTSIPLNVSYFNSTLNCTNNNLPYNGALIRNPSVSGPTPTPLGANPIPLYFSEADGFNNVWGISPSGNGFFSNASGNAITPTGTQTNIKWTVSALATVTTTYDTKVNGVVVSHCTGASLIVDVRPCNGCRYFTDEALAQSETANGELSLSPIPADHELWITNAALGSSIQITSMTGTEVVSTTQDEPTLKKRIDTSNLATALYLVRIYDMSNKPVVRRLMVHH